MVVKMMRWRPWPPVLVKKFVVKLRVKGVTGLGGGGVEKVMVEVRWKGGLKNGLLRRRGSVKRNCTKEGRVGIDGGVEWGEDEGEEEGFVSCVGLSRNKEGDEFHPWEIGFTVFNIMNQGPKTKVPIVGTSLLNLAEFASAAQEKVLEVNIPLTLPGAGADCEPRPSLCLSIHLLELRSSPESSEILQRSVMSASVSPQPAEASSPEKDDVSAIKAGLKKVKILTEYVSTRKSKKACREEEDSEGRCSARSEDADYTYPFDTEFLDDLDDGELDDVNADLNLRNSCSYGTLAHANYAGRSYYFEVRINAENEDCFYYSNRKSDVGHLHNEEATTSSLVSEQSLLQSSKRSILSWRKRKLSFRSPKPKGEPLLKKAYAEEGGDDIDYDRRQLNSSDESLSSGWYKGDEGFITNRSSISEFGDDNFAVGSWEQKEIISRDGHMKLQTQVFFASIDQRSERAGGESACTALVAVIADWFQSNQDEMPIKSQFDSLIREGSLEWRNLCENETYRTRFPDKHFDLETVLQANIGSLTVAEEKSFIGFFHPEGMEEGGLDFLHGAMSFDSIWDEISGVESESICQKSSQVYVVSWNDHFFVLKVEPEAYYIIDTLGERLYEGCNEAYILKFDKNTTILRLPDEEKEKKTSDKANQAMPVSTVAGSTLKVVIDNSKNEETVCQGKESCKEYIKSFLASIPIRELLVDMKKGLRDSTPLHHRLQIEFHYTELRQKVSEPQQPAAVAAANNPITTLTAADDPITILAAADDPVTILAAASEESTTEI